MRAEDAAAKTKHMKRLASPLGPLCDKSPHELEDPHNDEAGTDDGHDFHRLKPRKRPFPISSYNFKEYKGESIQQWNVWCHNFEECWELPGDEFNSEQKLATLAARHLSFKLQDT